MIKVIGDDKRNNSHLGIPYIIYLSKHSRRKLVHAVGVDTDEDVIWHWIYPFW